MEDNILGKRIKQRRIEIGLSAVQLANRLHISKATIYRYESGEIRDIKRPVIEAMAQALDVDPRWLVGDSRYRKYGYEEDGDAYRDMELTLNDFIIFIGNAESFKYGNSILNERDIAFLRSWIGMAKDYFNKLYK